LCGSLSKVFLQPGEQKWNVCPPCSDVSLALLSSTIIPQTGSLTISILQPLSCGSGDCSRGGYIEMRRGGSPVTEGGGYRVASEGGSDSRNGGRRYQRCAGNHQGRCRHRHRRWHRYSQRRGIVLIKDYLRNVATAIRLSRKILAKIKLDLFWAFAYNVALIPVAAGGLVPIFGPQVYTVLPFLAADAKAVSSATVIDNSLLFRSEYDVKR
jgi:hypothetical protein